VDAVCSAVGLSRVTNIGDKIVLGRLLGVSGVIRIGPLQSQ